jgi:hypothetical protein
LMLEPVILQPTTPPHGPPHHPPRPAQGRRKKKAVEGIVECSMLHNSMPDGR